MKENKYDDPTFFEKYSQMPRSVQGLQGAGEWHALRQLLPDFSGKRVLDLGCGFGWHCRYAAEHGAQSVIGVDMSEKMLDRARRLTVSQQVEYVCMPMEDVAYLPDSFEVVLSSLAFHYIEDFPAICEHVSRWLIPGGDFVFSVEHPVFTAYGNQEWVTDETGARLYWPVDRYFEEGERRAVFLGEEMTKYHRTVTTYVQALLKAGFRLTGLVEPRPDPSMLDTVPDMRDELRRPMMLLIAAKKEAAAAG